MLNTLSDLEEDNLFSEMEALFLEDSGDSVLLDDQSFSHEEASLQIVPSTSSLKSIEHQTNDKKIKVETFDVEHANITLASLQSNDALLLQERSALESIEDFKYALFFEVYHLSECSMIPTPMDVIFGKGGRLRHPGNRWFRTQCLVFAPRYLDNPTTGVKHKVALELVHHVNEEGRRFLMEDSKNRGTWRVVEFDLALKKAKQLLADLKKRFNPQQPHGARRRRANDDYYADQLLAMAT